MGNENEQIEATLEQIRFQKDGFMIGGFVDKHNNRLAALGNMVNPQIGLGYLMTGFWDENPKFGDQFRFSMYETVLPVDENGIYKYIVRVCKFVGSAVGQAIVDRYGDRTLTVMKGDPERLAREINGITLDRAKEIQATLLENEETENVMIELGVLLDIPGMRKDVAAKLVKIHRADAAEVVKENPYILTDFRGVGFSIADRVAMHIKFDRDSLFRKEAAVKHILKENLQNGSIWIHRDDLLAGVTRLIQVPEVVQGLDSLANEGFLWIDGDYVAPESEAESERNIAKIVIRLEAA